MAGIYFHIPFCRQACHYCDFHFTTNLSKMEDLVQAMKKELGLRKEYLGNQEIQTIYFGGGTPSLLSQESLESLINEVHKLFKTDLKETTLEANPDDLSPAKLQDWKSMGIDRLSLGIQSFNPQVLKFYNRSHSSDQAKAAIELGRKAGFGKFSFDLIYGFPQADHELWKSDLNIALAQDPGHISAYSLTVEPKTALGKWAEKGSFQAPEEDFVAEQFEWLQEQTEKAGYEQYEISNFGKPEHWALHNTNYWRGIPYLGIGPSAHSFDGKARGFNPASNPKYLNSLKANQIPFEIELDSPEDRINERILTALRTSWGIDLTEFEKEFSHNILQTKTREIQKLTEAGWLLRKDNHLSLTKSGKLLADSIAAELFI